LPHSPSGSIEAVHRYHDGTKHHFHRFARSIGYLDWASQPSPFRSFAGAREIPLWPRPDAPRSDVGDLLRHSLGLSAWKRAGAAKWSLRVNPSSGNLHPTEAYIVDGTGVYHYAPDRHALEERCVFTERARSGERAAEAVAPLLLIALTSIHWREAWKYGERAFRYCQHDIGHAIAAVAFGASLVGRRVRLLDWAHDDVAALTGVDRDADFFEAEREEPACVLALWPLEGHQPPVDRATLLDAVRTGTWTGKASQLSEDHVDWSFIDEIAAVTRQGPDGRDWLNGTTSSYPAAPVPPADPAYPAHLLLQRRSALALDGRSSIGLDQFFAMLARTVPDGGAPWDAVAWDARIHLAIFVHRVDGLAPGFYALVRHPEALERLRAACGRDYPWTRVTPALPLFELARGDARRVAARVSCDQEIAADGFFSLGMLADFDRSLQDFGAGFYRRLFWESGLVGQVLYLSAEAHGARGTGIGCFYDDPVHDLLGLSGHAFQSVYHFTIGAPLEDRRLTTEAGYPWE
jgi:SagB-type dehydrogenase family enzyme